MRWLARVAAALASVASALALQPRCEALALLDLPEVTITSAVSVAPGRFTLPNTTRIINAPGFCRVSATVWPEVRFEVWLPARWNRKFLGLGNGGQAGTINYAYMGEPLQRGYAVASTDTGHSAREEDWALNHFQRIVDYGYRGTHVMTQVAKAIIASYYGRAPEHSYFDGCSNGGRQALMEAQRFPEDYDGIIAGDPAADWTGLYTGGHLWTMRAMDGDGYIPPAKVSVLAEAVLKACDALDGLEDGLLGDPRRCRFDPGTLSCTAVNGSGSDAPNCFTQAQVAAIRKLWQGARTPSGGQIFPGLVPGGEDGPNGWRSWITGSAPGNSGHARLGLPGMRFLAFDDPAWDFRKFRFDNIDGFDNDVDFVTNKLGGILNATNPDLRRFQARGGRLLQYHGWSDPDISPLTSIEYYEKVARTVARRPTLAQQMAETGNFYRLFLAPGMQHCEGGPGPNRFDKLAVLERWVERGTPPERIIASHATGGAVDRTRPLCPYPKQARYTGGGSIDEAQNFVCAQP